jgi:hypothetical protein
MMPVLEMSSGSIGHINDAIYVYNVDASIQHSNSWFRMKGDKHQQNVYEKAMTHIQQTSKYPIVKRHEILKSRLLRPTYQSRKKESIPIETDYLYTPNIGISETLVNLLVKILDATQLPLLGSHLNISNSRILYARGIHVGILMEKPSKHSVLLLAKNHTDKNLEGLVGTLVISVKIPPDPDETLNTQLDTLFNRSDCLINLK